MLIYVCEKVVFECSSFYAGGSRPRDPVWTGSGIPLMTAPWVEWHSLFFGRVHGRLQS